MAWTGIAAILLPKGKTTHKTFRWPLNINDLELSILSQDCDKKRLREIDVIIWDEASMIPKKALEIVDRTLQDLCFNKLPFGGKLLILGGDFRQIAPVIKSGSKSDIILQTIKYSTYWPLFKKLKLTKNMRSINDKFSSLLLDIGNGKIDKFIIPEEWKVDDICERMYKDINKKSIINSIILTSHNEDVDKLNEKILKYIQGTEHVYYSVDHATHRGVDQTDDNIYLDYPMEMLNSIRDGIPNHILKLKINAIVMLLRNISISDGLCNGTRLVIKELYKYNIKAEIISGDKMGNIVFIPRITLNTGENTTFPFILYRKQFPIKLAFVTTFNKAQGQSYENVGLYITKPLFTHGQLYVGLSRGTNPNNIFIENKLENKDIIENIVWNEILEN